MSVSIGSGRYSCAVARLLPKLPGMRQTGQDQRERARYDVTDHLRVIKKRIDETGEGPLFLQDLGSPVKF